MKDKTKKETLIAFGIFAVIVVSIIVYYFHDMEDWELEKKISFSLFSGAAIVASIVGPFWRIYVNDSLDSEVAFIASILPSLFLLDFIYRETNIHWLIVLILTFVLGYAYYKWLRNEKAKDDEDDEDDDFDFDDD
jgi:hypothetical protein